MLDPTVSGRVERPVTSGRLRQDWALAGAGIADFLAPLQAAGGGRARVPGRADQCYWRRGAAVSGTWDR